MKFFTAHANTNARTHTTGLKVMIDEPVALVHPVTVNKTHSVS